MKWNKIYNPIRCFSLDIVLGTVAGTLYFSKLFHETVPLYWYAALALSVWAIYLSDHILDASKSNIKEECKPSFNSLMKKFLLINSILLLLLVLFFFQKELILPSLIIGGVAVSYLAIIYYWPSFFLKEVVIACIYSLGIVLYPTTFDNEFLKIIKQPYFIAYVQLVLGNVLFFSYTNSRKLSDKVFAIIVVSISILMNIFMITISDIHFIFALTQIFMGVILILCLVKNNKTNNAYYGGIADLVFLTPLILIFYPI